jgi:hypothetical protein
MVCKFPPSNQAGGVYFMGGFLYQAIILPTKTKTAVKAVFVLKA